MKLRYITLHLDFDSGFNDSFRNEFNSHSNFISNYLSRQVKALNFETDGTYNMLAIIPSNNEAKICKIMSVNALCSYIPLDKDLYEKMTDIEKYEYSLTLLEEGYHIASSCKKLPLAELLMLNQKFRDDGYKNEWLFKKKRFKDYRLEVSLTCHFTALYFKLEISVIDYIKKEKLISEALITTAPYEVSFKPLFRDIIIIKDNLVITEYLNRPKFIFSLSDIYEKNFSFQVTDVGLNYKPFQSEF